MTDRIREIAVLAGDGIGPEVIGLPIDQIIVSGNDKTQERWILKWAAIEPGMELTLPLLRKARQEIRDTDLFKTVTMQAERYENGELALHIIVEEKIFWLLYPRLSRNADGDVKVGIRLRVYNINGADQTLSVLAQQEEEGDGDDSDEIRMSYRWPLYSHPYDLFGTIGYKIENTSEDGFDNVETVGYTSFGVERDWNLDFLPMVPKRS